MIIVYTYLFRTMVDYLVQWLYNISTGIARFITNSDDGHKIHFDEEINLYPVTYCTSASNYALKLTIHSFDKQMSLPYMR